MSVRCRTGANLYRQDGREDSAPDEATRGTDDLGAACARWQRQHFEYKPADEASHCPRSRAENRNVYPAAQLLL